MKCPFCASLDTKVLDKRETPDLEETRRRRECLSCQRRFTTYEKVEQPELIVVKKNRTRQKFDKDKLKQGILKACEKRPIKIEKIDNIVYEIETELRDRNEAEIETVLIGELIMSKLKDLDKIAYIRFASVYREFTDLNTFKKEVSKLMNKK